MTQSSYIILGAGASGLMLAYRMSQDRNFDDKSILIIDQVKDKEMTELGVIGKKVKGSGMICYLKSGLKYFLGVKILLIHLTFHHILTR